MSRVLALLLGWGHFSTVNAQQPVVSAFNLNSDVSFSSALKLKNSQELRTPPEHLAEKRGDLFLPTTEFPNSRLQRLSLAFSPAITRGNDPVLGTPRLGLEELLAIAVQAHPDVLAKRADLDAAKANKDAALWQYFPSPSLQLRQQERGGNVTVAAVQQPLWSGGRIDAAFDAANTRTHSADVAITEAQYLLALRVTTSWQSWLQARGRAEALTRGLTLLNVYGESVRHRIKGGVSPEVDRELVESRLAQVKGDLAAANAAERNALLQLSQFIGKQLRAEELSPSVGSTDRLPEFDTLIERANGRSASLRRLESEIEASRYDVIQKRAVQFPTVGIRAEHQQGDLSNTGHVTNDNRVMLVLDYVPGAGLSASSGIDAAEARVRNLHENIDAAKRDLVTKIAADYEDHQSSIVRKQDIMRTKRAASEVLASYDRLYVAGKRSWLDVLNAARELMQVELSFADVDALFAASYFRIRLHSNEFPWQQGVTP